MKVLFQDYTFNAATKKVTFNTTETVALEQILLITNVTDNIIIYNFADPLKGGTILNNVLTLVYDTTTMSNTDSLQIFLDLKGTPSTEATAVAINETLKLLRRLVKVSEVLGTQDTQQRQRVAISGESSINIASMAFVDPRFQMIDWARTAYATGIRANIKNI